MPYRPEIDGLRAIAIIGVLLFHAGFDRFSGGYVGVDVFFVISGYLISRKLFEQMNAGTLSLVGFFINRARRLFPALLVTCIATFIVGAALFPAPYMKKLTESAIVSVLSLANVYFWSEAGYWDVESKVKPLLHVWSLSVEEQFYFAWAPLVMLVGGFRRRLPLVLGVGGASLLAAWLIAAHHPRVTFFWMPFRAFEFMLGAAVIWLERYRPSQRLIIEALACVGVLMIAIPTMTYDGATAFPIPGALLPCIGTALLIVAGPCLIGRIWDNGPARWIGRISYSLYLVHWPLIVYVLFLTSGVVTPAIQCALIAGSILLAMPLYYGVERRFRSGGAAVPIPDSLFLKAAVGISAAFVAIAFTAKLDNGWLWRSPDEIARLDPRSLSRCEHGLGLCGSPATVALIGDSHSDHYEIPVSKALIEAGLRGVHYQSARTCSLLPSSHLTDVSNKCQATQRKWWARIEAESPSVVILASHWLQGYTPALEGRYLRADGTPATGIEESRAIFRAQITGTIDRLLRGGQRVVVIGTTVLVDQPPFLCYDRPFINVSDKECASKNVLSDEKTQHDLDRFFAALSTTRPRMLYLNVTRALCDNGRCPLGRGGIPFYSDRHHLTADGAMWIYERAFSPLVAFLGSSRPEAGRRIKQESAASAGNEAGLTGR